MIAPSIALVVIFTIGAMAMGLSIAIAMGMDRIDTFQFGLAVFSAVPTLLLAGYYFLFRVPFAMVPIALGIYSTAFVFLSLFLSLGGASPDVTHELFRLSGNRPFAILTMILGLIFFAIALGFDMSDPHRVTRRAGAGFWLHVAAALAIVNTVAASLYVRESASGQLLLVLYVILMVFLAVIIDRRSYLIVGSGYIIALFFALSEDPFDTLAFGLVTCFGLGLVVLGAQWQPARCRIMRVLPHFPGKNRLPPWDSL